MKNDRWVYYKNVKPQDMGGGVACRVLAYSDDMMVMENTFEKGAVGFLHHHPHTQITYVASGAFLEIDGVKNKRSLAQFLPAASLWARSPLFWATDTLTQLSCPKLLPRRNQCS